MGRSPVLGLTIMILKLSKGFLNHLNRLFILLAQLFPRRHWQRLFNALIRRGLSRQKKLPNVFPSWINPRERGEIEGRRCTKRLFWLSPVALVIVSPIFVIMVIRTGRPVVVLPHSSETKSSLRKYFRRK